MKNFELHNNKKEVVSKKKCLKDYVEITESDFFPPGDERIYESPFENQKEYLTYKRHYEKYIKDFN